MTFPLIFLNFALNTYGTLNMFLLSVQTNVYIVLSSHVEGNMTKSHVWVLCLWFISRPAKFECFFWKITMVLNLKPFSGRNNSLEALFLDFAIVFYMIWKNQESWEPWSGGLELIGIQICKKLLPRIFFIFKLSLWIY